MSIAVTRENVTQVEVLGVTKYIEGIVDDVDLMHFPTIFNIFRFIIFPLMRNVHMMQLMARLLPFFGVKMISMVFRMPLFMLMMVVGRVFPFAKIFLNIL